MGWSVEGVEMNKVKVMLDGAKNRLEFIVGKGGCTLIGDLAKSLGPPFDKEFSEPKDFFEVISYLRFPLICRRFLRMDTISLHHCQTPLTLER